MFNGHNHKIKFSNKNNNKDAEAEYNTNKFVLNNMNDLINIPIQQLRTAQLKNFSGALFDQLYEEAMAIEHNQDIKEQNNNSFNKEIKVTPSKINKKKDEKIKIKNVNGVGQKPILYKLVKKDANKNKEKLVKKNSNTQKTGTTKLKSVSSEKNKIVKRIKKKVIVKRSLNESDINVKIIPYLSSNSNSPKTKKVNQSSKNNPKVQYNKLNQTKKKSDKKLTNSINSFPYYMTMDIINTNQNTNENTNNNNNEIKINKIIFSMKYNTHFGEEVGILGSIPDLGNWNQNQIFYLQWNDGNIWKGEIDFNSNPLTDFEYKFIISYNRTVKMWESGDNNKVIVDKLFNEIKYKKSGYFNKYEYNYDASKGELLLKCKWN